MLKSNLTSKSRTIGLLAGCLVAVLAHAPAMAAEGATQIKLSDALVKSYIAAQGDLKAISAKLEAAGDKEDPKLDAELEALAKKAGFKSYDELEDVSYSLSLVLDGYDAGSKTYGEPKAQLQKDLAEVKADKSMKADEKKQVLADIEEAIKTTPAIEHKENIELVKKYRDKLAKGD